MQVGDLLDEVCVLGRGGGYVGVVVGVLLGFFLVKFSGPAPCGILVP